MVGLYIQWAVYGFVVGALAAFLVLYGFQPRTVYPPWVIFLFDQPWIIFLFGLFGLYLLAVGDWVLGSLVVLLAVSLGADRANFATFVRARDLLDQGKPASALAPPSTSADQIRNDTWYEAVGADDHVGPVAAAWAEAGTSAGELDEGPEGWLELRTGQAVFHAVGEPQPGDPAPIEPQES